MKPTDKNEVNAKIISTLERIKMYLLDIVDSNLKRANNIINWMSDYINYIRCEEEYIKKGKYPAYKRGQVLYVNFGFNVGSEVGGYHYATVINNNDSASKSYITVIPLYSQKTETKVGKNDDRLLIGNALSELIERKQNQLLKEIDDYLHNINSYDKKDALSKAKFYQASINEMNKVIDRIKEGSIVLTGQIKTICKMRIANPTKSSDYLEKIVLSKDIVDLIINKVKCIFT